QVPSSGQDVANMDFGDVKVAKLGSGGARGLGFWTNNNGQALETQADFTALTALNLRNGTGAPVDFTGSLDANKRDLRNWLLGANAANMDYMLSSQLAAMKLNTLHGVNANALVSASQLSGFVGVYPTTGLGANGYISVANLMSLANNELGVHGLANSGAAWRR